MSGRATVDAFITSQTIIRYTYDPLSRLTSATYSGDYTYTFTYAYDAVGNRIAQTATTTSTVVTNYTYDAANRLTAVNGQAYTWDNNGNLQSDGSKTYLYNQANQLITVTAPGLTWSASYNGDGARLKQTVYGVETAYKTWLRHCQWFSRHERATRLRCICSTPARAHWPSTIRRGNTCCQTAWAACGKSLMRRATSS